jgi:hypothetical protein
MENFSEEGFLSVLTGEGRFRSSVKTAGASVLPVNFRLTED